MDLYMFEMNGFEVVLVLWKVNIIIFIIVFIVVVVVEEIDKVLVFGMNGYFIKLVNKMELYVVLIKYLGGEMFIESFCIVKGEYIE